MLEDLTFEIAQPLEGTVFHVEAANEQSIDLHLVSVALCMPNRPRSRRVKRDPFSLFFRGTNDQMLLQGTYRVTSDKLSFDRLFLVPIGRAEDGYFEYEAVFT